MYLATCNEEFEQHYPQPGWVEHRPDQIWASVEGAMAKALEVAGIRGESIAAIGITNQRETSVVWEKDSGKAIHNAIVWQCRRTADVCDSLKAAGHEETFRKRTGLVLDAYFSGTKFACFGPRRGGEGKGDSRRVESGDHRQLSGLDAYGRRSPRHRCL